MTETTKKAGVKKIVIGVVALAAAIVAVVAIYLNFGPKAVAGEKNITIEVIDNEQKSTVYELNTDAEFLRDAMEEAEGLEFTGTESEYGLMVESVNGVVADFSVDCSYWGFYVDGEYCMSGIDTQPVENGQAFQIIYTID